MNKEFICIACPNSCQLNVKTDERGEIKVVGHKCSRGVDFATSEMVSPMRCVSSSVKTVFDGIPVVPVRTSCEIPKEKIMPLMKVLKDIVLDVPCGRGYKIVENFDNTGVDIIVTTDVNRLLKG